MAKEVQVKEEKATSDPAKTTVVKRSSSDVWPLIGIAVGTLLVLGAVFYLGRYVGQNDSYRSYGPSDRVNRPMMMDRGYWR